MPLAPNLRFSGRMTLNAGGYAARANMVSSLIVTFTKTPRDARMFHGNMLFISNFTLNACMPVAKGAESVARK